nr:MAG TPA: hypothetical protein [Caudoviricetes sp.]
MASSTTERCRCPQWQRSFPVCGKTAGFMPKSTGSKPDLIR